MFTYKIEITREKKEKDKKDTHTQSHAYIVQIDKYITKNTQKLLQPYSYLYYFTLIVFLLFFKSVIYFNNKANLQCMS